MDPKERRRGKGRLFDNYACTYVFYVCGARIQKRKEKIWGKSFLSGRMMFFGGGGWLGMDVALMGLAIITLERRRKDGKKNPQRY